jgi:hypothetical protein
MTRIKNGGLGDIASMDTSNTELVTVPNATGREQQNGIESTDIYTKKHSHFVGEKVSYHQNGRRAGIIKQLDPERGLRKGMMQVTHGMTGDLWVSVHDVNVFGDTVYHGPKALDVFEERTEEKKAQQAKADKLKVRRFHR